MRTTDKTVIITGGNSGLGFETARAILLADEGWRVVLATRSTERGRAAAERLIAETSNPGVESVALDLASMASIRRFVSLYATLGLPPLRALVCNAGVQFSGPTQFTEDGFEATFGVNHLGHFLLSNLLRRQMQAPARVVFVSSGTHDPAQRTGMPAPRFDTAEALALPADEDEAKRNPGLVGRRRYTTSKLCNVLCAYEMDRRARNQANNHEQSHITVNAFDPGLMPGTGLIRNQGPVVDLIWKRLAPLLRIVVRPLYPNTHRPEESGRALARLVIDPTLAGVSGRYFEGLVEVPSSEESRDEAKASALWDQSAALVGLTGEEAAFGTSALLVG